MTGSTANESVAHELLLTVDGVRYGGWTGGTVERSIENMSGGFRLELTDPWDGTPPIGEQSRCTLQLGGETVISGYVDTIEIEESATSHGITVSGRDAAGDLVDCSAVHPSGEWRGLSLREQVFELAQPFGINVRTDTSLDGAAPFPVFRLEEGETAWRAIDRACRFRQALCVSDGAGGLVLTRAGKGRADVELRRGENVLSIRFERSSKDRFSSYTVKGQRDAADDEPADRAAHGIGSAGDPGVRRYRPRVLVAEDQSDDGSLAGRAGWEASTRAGRSQKMTVTVQGWRQTAGGRLWRPNERVRVVWRRIDQEMLISAVRHQLGANTTTELTLVPPGAFEAKPLAGDGGSW